MTHIEGGAIEMDWVLSLTANSVDDSETLQRILTTNIVGGGGWFVGPATAGRDAVKISFEFEREGCVEMYAALMDAGLDFTQASHLQLAQLCHCSQGWERDGEWRVNGVNHAPSSQSFETARVDLKIMPEQLDGFDRRPERGTYNLAWRFRS